MGSSFTGTFTANNFMQKRVTEQQEQPITVVLAATLQRAPGQTFLG